MILYDYADGTVPHIESANGAGRPCHMRYIGVVGEAIVCEWVIIFELFLFITSLK